jgi:hypothetical protein
MQLEQAMCREATKKNEQRAESRQVHYRVLHRILWPTPAGDPRSSP